MFESPKFSNPRKNYIPGQHGPNQRIKLSNYGIQLREKHMSSLELLDFGRKIQKIINNRALFIINDRVDIAMALKSDGIHLGEKSIPINLVKNLLGKEFLIGKSIHQVDSSLSIYESLINYWILVIFSTLLNSY